MFVTFELINGLRRRLAKQGAAQKEITKLRSQISSPSSKPTCLVLMPFSSAYDAHFAFIQRSAESVGFECFRVDKFESEEPIIRQVLRNILRADLIVADLSGDNPNVFYELGISQTLMRKVILIRDDTDKIPFDLAAYRVLKIPSVAEGDRQDRTWAELDEALSNMAANQENGGPVVDVLGRLSIRVGQNLFWRRIFGHAIDLYVIIFLVYGLSYFLDIEMRRPTLESADARPIGDIYLGIGFFLSYFLFHTILIWLWGRTPGKFVSGIAVEPRVGRKVGLGRAAVRAIIQTLGFVLLGLPFWFAAIGPNFEGLHDRISRTKVVRKTIVRKP